MSVHYLVLLQLLFAFNLAQITSTDHHVEEHYPFLVKIEAKGKILDCAGTILTPCSVLTSAHCVEGIDSSEVTVSHFSSAVIKYRVASTVIHPKYNSTVLANDIALVQIKQKFQEPWEAISLNSLATEKVFAKCYSFQILGWSGHIIKDSTINVTGFSEKPMKAPVKLISNENCSDLIKNFGGIFQGEEKLCGVPNEEGDEEGCFTGPGGPLLCSLYSNTPTYKTPKKVFPFKQVPVHKTEILADPIDLLENFRKSEVKTFKREIKKNERSVQVGVVSWGKSCSKVPSVYIKTNFYSKWIMETAKKLSKKCAPGYKPLIFWIPLSNGGAKLCHFTDLTFVIISAAITVLSRFL